MVGRRTEKSTVGEFDGLAEAAHGKVDQSALFLLVGVQEVHEKG